MTNIEIKDAQNLNKYVKSTGAGSNGDPFIPSHAVEGTVEVTSNFGKRERIMKTLAQKTRAAASAITINAGGIIQASTSYFHELTGVTSTASDAFNVKFGRCVISGGAHAAAGSLALQLWTSAPGEVQTEGGSPLFTAAEGETFVGQINLNRKITNTNCQVLYTDDTSEWNTLTLGSTSIHIAIVSLNSWATTGTESFDIDLQIERIV